MSQRVGITSLVLAHRHPVHGDVEFDAHVQSLPGGLEVLVGPVNPDAATSLDRELGAVGPEIFPSGIDMLVDCGRVLADAPGQRRILEAADEVVVVTRPDAAGLVHAHWIFDIVRTVAPRATTSVIIVGPSQYSAGEIAQVFHAKLLGAIPVDQRSAAMACGLPGKPRRFARSSLVASVRPLVDRLSRRSDFGGETESLGDLGVDDSSVESTLTAPRLEVAALGEQGPGVG